MANTYCLIGSYTVPSGGQAEVRFDDIPQTYTDLVVRYSARCSSSSWNTTSAMTINDSLSRQTLTGVKNSINYYNHSFVADTTSLDNTNDGFQYGQLGHVPGTAQTSSSFNTQEIVFPGYTIFNTEKIWFSEASAPTASASSNYLQQISGSWENSTEPIRSLQFFFNDGATFLQNSKFSLYGLRSDLTSGAKATGGSISTDGTYIYHTFGSSGNLTTFQSISSVEVLAVAGGGGGSRGGGGAGGYVYSSGQTLASQTTYLATVGAGGARVTSSGTNGSAGTNSNLTGGSLSLTAAVGGGYGGGTASAGGNGGSGGGAGYGGSASGGTFTSGQGGTGGSGVTGASGGGGGAGGNGATGTGTTAGAGGTGITTYSTWMYAGMVGYNGGFGGGGGSASSVSQSVAGGAYGGGRGRFDDYPENGWPQTGGGGGGGGTTYLGRAGGSGFVIVRYPV